MTMIRAHGQVLYWHTSDHTYRDYPPAVAPDAHVTVAIVTDARAVVVVPDPVAWDPDNHHYTFVNGSELDGGQVVTWLSVTGLEGATAGLRLVGGTSAGAPTEGTFETGDIVATLYSNYANLVLVNEPVVYYKLDEEEGTVAVDSSGNGYDGAYAGDYTLGELGNIAGDGTSVGFGATDGVMDYSGVFTAPTNTFAFECWVSPEAAIGTIPAEAQDGVSGIGTGQKFAVWADATGPGSSLGLSVGTNGIVIFQHRTDNISSLCSYTAPIDPDTYIVGNVDAKEVVLWVNGTLVHTGLTSDQTTVYAPRYDVGGGQLGTYGAYEGTISQFAIYDDVLSPDDIAAHYAAGLPSGVIARWWRCLAGGTPGTWVEMSPASSESGMVNPMTTAGDLIAGGVAGDPGRLGIGATRQLLTTVAGEPAWSFPTSRIVSAIVDTVVDLSTTDLLILDKASGIAATLPEATADVVGRIASVRQLGAGMVTVNAAINGGLVNGAATFVYTAQYETHAFMAVAVNTWAVVNGYVPGGASPVIPDPPLSSAGALNSTVQNPGTAVFRDMTLSTNDCGLTGSGTSTLTVASDGYYVVGVGVDFTGDAGNVAAQTVSATLRLHYGGIDNDITVSTESPNFSGSAIADCRPAIAIPALMLAGDTIRVFTAVGGGNANPLTVAAVISFLAVTFVPTDTYPDV